MLDDEGCVSAYEPQGGKRYRRLQQAFGDMVNADDVFRVDFGEGDRISGFDPDTRMATINPLDIQRKRYVSGSVLACAFGGSSTAAFSLPSILTHELIGHGSPMASGLKPARSALWAENLYHAAVGEPRRCSEYK